MKTEAWIKFMAAALNGALAAETAEFKHPTLLAAVQHAAKAADFAMSELERRKASLARGGE